MSEPKKPVLDEQALGKLLEAAFVIQEHGAEVRKARSAEATVSEPNRQGQRPASENSAIPTQASTPIPVSEKSAEAAPVSQDAFTLTLARIVETQQQILGRGLELESALVLVAQRTAEITKASGSAIGILESKKDGKALQYRAVSGLLTLARGSEVPMEKALSFNSLRSGEVTRCTDVNADFLLDTEECRRRGIKSLIAVPIYRDSGIAGAMELYFAGTDAFSEQEVHGCQLMAGLVTETLARDAGVSSRKSLAAERATMLEALEKLQPNLAALVESPSSQESISKSAPPQPSPPKAAATTAAVASSTVPFGIDPMAGSPAAEIPFCRKCGNEMMGEEMFCGKCGSPRSSEYRPPTIQSKLASIWHKQQALKQNTAPGRANGSQRPTEQKSQPGIPTEIQPWEAVLSELSDPFAAELETTPPQATKEPEAVRTLAVTTESTEQMRKEAIEISAAAKRFSKELDSPGSYSPGRRTPVVDSTVADSPVADSPVVDSPVVDSPVVDSPISYEPIEYASTRNLSMTNKASIEDDLVAPDLEVSLPLEAEPKTDEKAEDGEPEKPLADAANATAQETTSPLTWSSAAKAKEAFERLAAGRNQNSFLRFWNSHRGDVYLAIAILLVAAVVRWSITSEHSFGANSNASAARINHHRPAPDADISTFDKLLISLGLADPPDPPENKGNPDTQVWVDLRSAMYYCPGADLYGKTPQGKYSSQRDAQLGQFEPAYHKACN